MSKNKITIRLTAEQMLVLDELKDALDTNISLMCRAIIGNFITTYSDRLEEIIINKKQNHEVHTGLFGGDC